MIPKIIEVRNNEPVYNLEVLTLEPLKCLIDTYPKDVHMKMLKVLYFYYPSEDNEKKAFVNIEEYRRLDYIIEHFKCQDLNLKVNEDFCRAFDFLKDVFETTIEKTLLASKENIEQLNVWARTSVTDGVGGNAAQKMTYSKNILDTIVKHEELEEFIQKQMTKSRGNKKVARDIDKNYE